MSRVTETRAKRTNSLAFASVDCHTCLVNGAKCDRKRPQCATCISKEIRCAGFATPLSWDHRRMWVANEDNSVDMPPERTKATRTTQAKVARKLRFVGPTLRKAPGGANPQRASGGPKVATGNGMGNVAASTATMEITAPSKEHGPVTTDTAIGGISIPEPYDQSVKEVPTTSQAVLSGSDRDIVTEYLTSVAQDQLSNDLPSFEFPMIPSSMLFSLDSDDLATSMHQVITEDEENTTDSNQMDIEEVCANNQNFNTYDIQQQNIWSPLLDFIETPPALPLVQNISNTSTIFTDNHEELLNICK